MHIIQRGNNRAACFRARSDYLLYLLHLKELARKFDCAVHAYCLMTNHVHLLLTPGAEDSLTLMRELGQRYVQYFNRRHGRTGTLWEGRFRSSIVESARYVLACYRYIELNPVRARLCEGPEAYEWSSHHATARQHSDALIAPHAELLALGNDAQSRQAAYLGLFGEGLAPELLSEIRANTNAGYPLASEGFKSGVLAPLGFKLGPGRAGRPAKDLHASKSGSDPDFWVGLR